MTRALIVTAIVLSANRGFAERFIVENGEPRAEIVIAEQPERTVRVAAADLRAFVTKMKAGANLAITQYFFNADAYFRFRDEAQRAGVDAPIVPGIMPITNYVQLARFSDACGAEIPRWIRTRLADYGDDLDSIRAFGVDVVTDLCRRNGKFVVTTVGDRQERAYSEMLIGRGVQGLVFATDALVFLKACQRMVANLE